MRKRWTSLSLGGFMMSVAVLGSAMAEKIALSDVTVIPMTGARPLEHRTVIIEDGRISAIQKRSKGISDGIRVIDCGGKYLIPGLWDMHVHLTKVGPSALPLFLANGVTSVRDMGGDPTESLVWRDEIEQGSRMGPQVKTSGPILESDRYIQRLKGRQVAEPVERTRVGVGTPEEAGAAVERLAGLGVDFLKMRTFQSKATYAAIAAAAEEAGLQLVGHADLAYEDMLRAGQASYEHFPRRLLNNKSEKERRAIWRDMAREGVVVVPTLINYHKSILVPFEELEGIVEDIEGTTDSRRRYVSPRLLEDWREQVVDRQESYASNRDSLIESSLRNMREMHEEGVRILPGTDVAVVLMYPGFSLHEELEALVERVGMTAEEALYAATRHAAEFMGVEASRGTIEVGKEADLVLLDANPLADIQNTTRIFGVVSRGDFFDRARLDAMLQQVAEEVKS